MITFLCIDDYKLFSHAEFIEQLLIYNEISTVYLIDNSVCESDRNEFLGEISNYPFENVVFTINEVKQSIGSLLNQFIKDTATEVLVVNPFVRISADSIFEMMKICTLSRHHSYIIPRTNDGNYQTLPVENFIFDKNVVCNEEYAKQIMNGLFLYTVMPSSYDCCVLVDTRYLFDICAFNENYLCLDYVIREHSILLSNYGYNTISSNKAFAECVKDISDLQCRNRDNTLFESRLSEHMDILKDKYLNYYLKPQEYFSSRILAYNNQYKFNRRKLLYFMPHVEAKYNGSAMHALGLLSGMFNVLNREEYEMTIVASKEAIEYFGMKNRYGKGVCTVEEINDLFDIAFAPYHIFSYEDNDLLTKFALKVIAWPLDVISDRSNYLSLSEHLKVHNQLARTVDGLVFSSKEAKSDYEQFFYDVANIRNIPKRVSYIVPEPLSENECQEELPFEDYFLIMGNTLMHKMISQTVEIVKKTDINFIVIGVDKPGFISDRIYGYCSGDLSEEKISKIYRECRALIFPSIYEGFGLPVVQILNMGKKVILMESDLNHELENLCNEFKDKIIYLKSLHELPDKLDLDISENEMHNYYDKSWNDVARECISFIDKVMNESIDYKRLELRWLLRERY